MLTAVTEPRIAALVPSQVSQVTLGKLIGDGNFGSVRLGVVHLNAKGPVPVAIKQPKKGWSNDFRAEIATMQSLQTLGGHGNIVRAVGVASGGPASCGF